MAMVNSTDLGAAVGRETGSGEVSDMGYLISGIYINTLAIIATAGNMTVLLVFIRDRSLRTKPHNILILNLAVSDLGISFLGYPFVMSSTYATRWLYGDTMCKVYAFFTYLFSMASEDGLVAISVFRFIIIVRPKYKYLLTQRNVYRVVAAVWAYAFIWPVLPFMGWSYYTYEPFHTSCTIAWNAQTPSAVSYDVIVTITCFIVHIAIIMYCYFRVLRKAMKLQLSSGHPRGFTNTKMNKEKRTSFMCLFMVLAFLISWTPYAVMCLVTIWKPLSARVTLLPTMLAKSSPCFNPIIYCILNQRFRRAIYRRLCCCFNRKVAPTRTVGINPKFDQMNVFYIHRPSCPEATFVRPTIPSHSLTAPNSTNGRTEVDNQPRAAAPDVTATALPGDPRTQAAKSNGLNPSPDPAIPCDSSREYSLHELGKQLRVPSGHKSTVFDLSGGRSPLPSYIQIDRVSMLPSQGLQVDAVSLPPSQGLSQPTFSNEAYCSVSLTHLPGDDLSVTSSHNSADESSLPHSTEKTSAANSMASCPSYKPSVKDSLSTSSSMFQPDQPDLPGFQSKDSDSLSDVHAHGRRTPDLVQDRRFSTGKSAQIRPVSEKTFQRYSRHFMSNNPNWNSSEDAFSCI